MGDIFFFVCGSCPHWDLRSLLSVLFLVKRWVDSDQTHMYTLLGWGN